MKKELFLRAEYDRIITSGDYMWSGWRESYKRFQANLWDRTPTSGRGGWFLPPIVAELGFGPENVEWHFPKARQPKKTEAKTKLATKTKSWVNKVGKPKALTPRQKRAAQKLRLQAEKQAKRESLAAEFMRWEKKQSA